MSRARIAILLLCALAMGLTSATVAAQNDLELKVKAAFLFNFLKFVTWPPGRAPTAADPPVLCVVGAADFAAVLAETVRDKAVEGNEVRVLKLDPGESFASCHVAYFAATSTDTAEAQLRGAAGRGVLTVHEADQAVPSGVVRFFLEDRRVRFELNTTAAEREQLQLSSRLLGVARRVQVGAGTSGG